MGLVKTEGVPPSDFLRDLRRINSWNQRDIADAVGFTQSQYSRVEAGSQVLSADQWIAAARWLAVGSGSNRELAQSAVFFLIWLPAHTHDFTYVQDAERQVAVFESGRDACCVAAALSIFREPSAAVPATPEFASVEIPFSVGPDAGLLRIPDSDRLDESRTLASDFVSSALKARLS